MSSIASPAQPRDPASTRPQWPLWRTRVLPVVVISDVQQALPLAHALLEGGIDAIEVTLRHHAALAAIEALSRQLPQMHVGAGTLTQPEQVQRVIDAGASFALSPGYSEGLLERVRSLRLPFIPGVMTPGEAMRASAHGYPLLKLFPAAVAGGVDWLQAVRGPLPELRFCPTGGVSADNLRQYLEQPNVAMVGGTWIAPLSLIEQGQWQEIAKRAKAATEAVQAWSASAQA